MSSSSEKTCFILNEPKRRKPTKIFTHILWYINNICICMLLQFSTQELYNWTRINKEAVRHLEFPFQTNRFVFTKLSTTVRLLDNNRHDTY